MPTHQHRKSPDHVQTAWPLTALDAAAGIGEDFARSSALASIGSCLPASQRAVVMAEALAAAAGIAEEEARAQALADLAPHLPQELLGEALDAARSITQSFGRVEALASGIQLQAGDQRFFVRSAC
jgi:hypothetical protein